MRSISLIAAVFLTFRARIWNVRESNILPKISELPITGYKEQRVLSQSIAHKKNINLFPWKVNKPKLRQIRTKKGKIYVLIKLFEVQYHPLWKWHILSSLVRRTRKLWFMIWLFLLKQIFTNSTSIKVIHILRQISDHMTQHMSAHHSKEYFDLYNIVACWNITFLHINNVEVIQNVRMNPKRPKKVQYKNMKAWNEKINMYEKIMLHGRVSNWAPLDGICLNHSSYPPNNHS